VYYPKEGIYDAELVVLNPFKALHVVKENLLYIFDTLADYRTAEYIEDFEVDEFPNEWIRPSTYFNRRFELADVGFESPSAAFVDNFNETERLQHYSIISPSFDLSYLEAPKLTFHYAHSLRNSSNTDKFTIYTSTDCGKKWNVQFTLSGNSLATA